VFGKWHENMWGKDYLTALRNAKERLDSIEVDRLRVKPVVKITGEFWAQLTEGDGNFHMFEFLEREGAQVVVEPIATWVAYLMYQAKAHATAKWPVNRPHRNPKWYELKKQFANYIGLRKKLWAIGAGQRMWNFFYHRTIKHLGGSRTILCRKPSWRNWRIRFTTSLPVEAKGISKSGRTFITPSTGFATWCSR